MSKNFSLEGLSGYITDSNEKIGAVRKETEEIQIGFNSAYVEWKAEHDATLERLTAAVIDRLEEVGPDLQTRVGERVVEERRIIAERCQALRDKLIPETQTGADETLGEGQRLVEKLRELNPRLDQREEKLKAERAALEAKLAQLNEHIHDLSGCLGVVIRFPKINKLDRQRQRVIGKLETVHQELKEVRQEWQTTQHQIQAEQETLQARWQESTLRLAQLQAELDFLDDEASREAMARKRATRHVIDNLKQPLACPIKDLKKGLDRMVEVNIQADDYQAGLGSASSLLSVLDGISDGLNRFNESVQGLIREHKLHSAYLPKLNVSIPDQVLGFHEQWDGLRRQVRDDGHLCTHPNEFVTAVRPVMEGGLAEANIKAMFDSLGQALSQATSSWRG